MSNLKSWPPGTSGNPKGRPIGSRNFRTVIRDMLENPHTWDSLPANNKGTGTPLEAIISTLLVRSINGDVRAADTLLKYAVNRDELLDENDNSFFNANSFVIKIVKPDGTLSLESDLRITSDGMLSGFENS